MIKGTERRAERPIDLRTAALAAVASRVSHSTTIVMLIAGAAQHVTVHVSTHVPIWQSIALVIGAAATTASAIAAWRAAGKSSDAARDARDALAASLKPHVELVFGEFHTREVAEPPVEVRAVVLGPLSPMGVAAVLPAADVRLQVNLSSGKQDFASMQILQPNAARYPREPPYLNVVIGERSDDWPPPEGIHVTATVTYSDVRGAASYRKAKSVDLRRSTGDSWAISYQNQAEEPETLLSPIRAHRSRARAAASRRRGALHH
jgi:hypothetical protein